MSVVTIGGGSSERIERVHVDGLGYKTASGKAWHGYSMTGFRDYQRFLVGEDIRPLLAQARDLGANMRRVFGMWGYGFVTPDNFGPFKPQNFPDYYRRLPEFCALLAEYGLWLEFTVFADTSDVMPNQAEQLDHFNTVCATLRLSENTFVELVNENDQHGNGVNIGAFRKPDGLAACSGSNGSGSNPTLPLWDYSNLHAERRPDRMGITTSTVYYAINGYKGENGEPDWNGTKQATNNDEPGRTLDPFTAYQMGVGSRYGAWVASHTPNGTQSVLLDPTQAECTRQMFRGARGLDFSA